MVHVVKYRKSNTNKNYRWIFCIWTIRLLLTKKKNYTTSLKKLNWSCPEKEGIMAGVVRIRGYINGGIVAIGNHSGPGWIGFCLKHNQKTPHIFFSWIHGKDSFSNTKLLWWWHPDHANHRHGNFIVPSSRPRNRQGCHSRSHQSGLPTFRHRLYLRVGAGSGCSHSRGSASRTHQLQEWALHHNQALGQFCRQRPRASCHQRQFKVINSNSICCL